MALLVETVITAGLVFCIFAFTDAHNKVADGAAPVLIGNPHPEQNPAFLSVIRTILARQTPGCARIT